MYNSYLKWTSTIIDYSLFTNIPITWYEDLYNIDSSITKNIIDSWQLNDDVNIILPNFDIKNKYRKSNDILI